jgi:Nucleotide-diphospho-sugar transferase
LSRATRGFVYATTGDLYTSLARRSARNLRALMPHAQIDLFTDQPITDPVFDRIAPLNRIWFRPKMEALLRSRFDRTVLLDADTIAVMKVADLFAAVDHCDLAACMSTGRPMAMYRGQPEIPRSFPYLNSGMMVVRRNRRTTAMIREWEHMVRVHMLPKDQPALRWLLFHRRIAVQVLPMEYNLVNIPLLDIWENHFGAPRILHVQDLHDSPPGDPTRPFDLDQALGPVRGTTVREQVARTLARANLPDSYFPDVTGRPAPLPNRARFAFASVSSGLRRIGHKLLLRSGLR